MLYRKWWVVLAFGSSFVGCVCCGGFGARGGSGGGVSLRVVVFLLHLGGFLDDVGSAGTENEDLRVETMAEGFKSENVIEKLGPIVCNGFSSYVPAE